MLPRTVRKPLNSCTAFLITQAQRACAGQRGDTLMEVLWAAVVLGIVAVGTFNGLAVVGRASALSRARSQAQALAEQDEERLRGEPITAIQAMAGSAINRKVKLNGTVYTVTTRVELVSENGSSLCTSTSPVSGVYRTSSEVTWWGGGRTHSVTETSSIPPPPGAALIVSFEGVDKGEPVQGIEATLTGPSPQQNVYQATSTASGCVIFGPFESGGLYTLNAHRPGFVDSNNYASLAEDPAVQTQFNLLTSTIVKTGFRFAEAGMLLVKLSTAKPPNAPENWTTTTAAPNVVIANNSMHPEARTLAKQNGSYLQIESEKPGLFPYTYAVYAGICGANNPQVVAEEQPTEATVPPGGAAEAQVTMPDLIVRVYGGSEPSESGLVPHPKIVATDSQCNPHLDIEESETTTESTPQAIMTQGDLADPGVPAGFYTVCNEWEEHGKIHSVLDEHVAVPLKGKTYAEVTLLRGKNIGETNRLVEGSCPR